VRRVCGFGAALVITVIGVAGCGSEETPIVVTPKAKVLFSGQVPESSEDPWGPPFQTERVVVDPTQPSSLALKQAEAALLNAKGWHQVSEPDPAAIEFVSRDKKRFAAILTINDALREGPSVDRARVKTELLAERRAARSGTPSILVIAGPQ
jgi:GrpB-like predicted nucleotidyltransferase (UPF0157 family)